MEKPWLLPSPSAAAISRTPSSNPACPKATRSSPAHSKSLKRLSTTSPSRKSAPQLVPPPNPRPLSQPCQSQRGHSGGFFPPPQHHHSPPPRPPKTPPQPRPYLPL